MLFFVLFAICFVCVAFCYLFYRILEIEKDIENLYDNYSGELEKIMKMKVKRC